MIDSESTAEPPSEAPTETIPCALCGRKFLEERLEKHQKICNKIKESKKKRKVFESNKQRAELEQVNGYPVTPPSRSTTASEDSKATNKTSNWRAKHEEFLRTVRQARGEKVDDPVTNGDGQSPRVPVGYIVCQFCGRNFSDKAADRHIEFCKEQKARIPRSANNTKALERMKARTKYKPTPNTKSSPKTETPPKSMGSRSQPPTPPTSRKGSDNSVKKPTPPKSLPAWNSSKTPINSKTSPKVIPKNARTTPSPPTKSKFDKQRINSLSRPKNLSPDSVEHLLKQTEPVMKFKEKFPNHTSHTNFIRNDTMKELLKKTESYTNAPRTVPGVRTGGMSPIKSDNYHSYNHQNGHQNNHYISEDEELAQLKARIEDMYLNGSTKFKPNSLQQNAKPEPDSHPVTNGTNGMNGKANSESTTRGSSSGSSVESSSIPSPPRDEVDGRSSQASSATSTGLPKFCHQCGTKYPTTIAKYCYECGSRRLGSVGPFITLDQLNGQ